MRMRLHDNTNELAFADTRKFWLLSGPDHYYDFGRKLAMQLGNAGLTVLVFCPSRVAAERMLSRVRAAKDEELSFVRVYRAGLSAAEREQVESGLRDRSIRVVFSTSALELGIDIGTIDAVICVSLPTSMMSLWQRAGRAARGGKEGAIILIPGDTPIDSYYAAHPDQLFSKDNEPLVLNPNNRRVVHQHYACAKHEIGGDEEQLNCEILGDAMDQVRRLRATGQLDDDIFYRSDPHMEANIRSIGAGSYSLEVGQDSIGEIDAFHLLREAYRNAIYRHGGRSYRVKDLLKGKRKIVLTPEYSGHETTPFIQKKIAIKRRMQIADYPSLMVATCAIDVTEFLVSVTEKDKSGKVVNQWLGSGGTAPHTLPTEGTVLLLRKSFWSPLVDTLGTIAAKSALQSAERLLWSLFPTVSGPFDVQDFSSASEAKADGEAAIYLYDLVYDGVDLAIGAFERISELVAKALERVMTCDCPDDSGCFRCIANPRVEEPASKAATRSLLEAIQAVFDRETVVRSCSEPTLAESLATSSRCEPCKECGAALRAADRFCGNCGHRVQS